MKLENDLYAIDKTLLVKAQDTIVEKHLKTSPLYLQKSVTSR